MSLYEVPKLCVYGVAEIRNHATQVPSVQGLGEQVFALDRAM